MERKVTVLGRIHDRGETTCSFSFLPCHYRWNSEKVLKLCEPLFPPFTSENFASEDNGKG